MGEVTSGIIETGSAASRANELFSQALSHRQLSMVRARLVANLGASVASWFRIEPSTRNGGGNLQLAALLLDAHLPILVPLSDFDAGSVFYVASYDVYGVRVEMSQRAEMSRFSSLAEALLASDLAFRQLKQQSEHYRMEAAAEKHIGSLAEERWLHEQLRRVPANA